MSLSFPSDLLRRTGAETQNSVSLGVVVVVQHDVRAGEICLPLNPDRQDGRTNDLNSLWPMLMLQIFTSGNLI